MICSLVDRARSARSSPRSAPTRCDRGQRTATPAGSGSTGADAPWPSCSWTSPSSPASGNVYRCEVLHRLAVDPLTPGRELEAGLARDLGRPRAPHAPRAAFSQIITMPDQVEEAAEQGGRRVGPARSPGAHRRAARRPLRATVPRLQAHGQSRVRDAACRRRRCRETGPLPGTSRHWRGARAATRTALDLDVVVAPEAAAPWCGIGVAAGTLASTRVAAGASQPPPARRLASQSTPPYVRRP